MFLSRYGTSKQNIIYEINPSNGSIIRRFKQPKDWVWDPERPKAKWGKYFNRIFFLFEHDNKIIFQVGKNRFDLDENYRCSIERIKFFWNKFRLYNQEELVFQFYYREPQTKLWSLLCSLGMDDNWWEWDTPFDDVRKYLEGINP